MKKLFAVLASIIVVITVFSMYSKHENYKKYLRSDKYIRDRVLMITGNGILCSAIEVKAPSGKSYTMSAAHCYEMAVAEHVMAIAEDGSKHRIKVLKVDKDLDLMLLEGFDSKSIDIAKEFAPHEKVHTLTHGRGAPTYRTDGELLVISDIKVGIPINSEEDEKKCFHIIATEDGQVCELDLSLMMSTAKVLPGSSGGAVLDDKGHLVGIVSCSDDFFSGFVPLYDIQNFIKGY